MSPVQQNATCQLLGPTSELGLRGAYDPMLLTRRQEPSGLHIYSRRPFTASCLHRNSGVLSPSWLGILVTAEACCTGRGRQRHDPVKEVLRLYMSGNDP